MKYALALVALALPLIAATAKATDINVGEASVEAASVDSNSKSLAGAAVVGSEFGQVTFEASQPLAKQKIRQVGIAPDISIVGGNPCMVSVGASAGFMGGAFGVGLGIEDPGCETRQQVALLANMGYRDIALLHMCKQLEDVGDTLSAMGYNCLQAEALVNGDKDSMPQRQDPVFPASGQSGGATIVGAATINGLTYQPTEDIVVVSEANTEIRSDGFRWSTGNDR